MFYSRILGRRVLCLVVFMAIHWHTEFAYAQPFHGMNQEPFALVDATLPAYGSALNATTLQNAITAQGSNKRTIFLKCGTWTLATNVTAPANITLWMPYCTFVTINAGITLTLNSPPYVENPTWHIGTGKLTLLYSLVNMRDMSTAGDGSSGSPWTGWDTAVTSWKGSITYLLPPGHYQLTAPVLLTENATQLVGAGKDATIIHYAPTTSSTTGVLTWASGSQINFRSGGRGFSLVTTNTTNTKVGIKLVDVSGFMLSDVRVGSDGAWTGTGSIGLLMQGRDASVIEGAELYGDRPLVISNNPNSTVDLDHVMFRDLLLQETIAGANPVVEIESGLNITNVSFDGDQAWYRGNIGLSWIDTATTIRGANLTLQNVRWEQGSDPTGYFVQIEHNTALRNLRLVNLFGALNSRGIRLRNVQAAKLENIQYMGAAIALDLNVTTYPVVLENVWIGNGTIIKGALSPAIDSGSSDGRIIPFLVYDR